LAYMKFWKNGDYTVKAGYNELWL